MRIEKGIFIIDSFLEEIEKVEDIEIVPILPQRGTIMVHHFKIMLKQEKFSICFNASDDRVELFKFGRFTDIQILENLEDVKKAVKQILKDK